MCSSRSKTAATLLQEYGDIETLLANVDKVAGAKRKENLRAAVASDILDIARGDNPPPFGVPAAKLKPYKRAKLGQHQGAYYVRLSVYDRPGAMAGKCRSRSLSPASSLQ